MVQHGFALSRRRLFASVVTAIVLLASADIAIAQTTYTLSGAAPPTANWTDPIWIPAGYPGSGTGDISVAPVGSPAITITVDSTLNPLTSLDFDCDGCVIDIVSGGTLELIDASFMKRSSIMKVNGGTLKVNVDPEFGGLLFTGTSLLHLRDGMIQGGGNSLISIDPTASMLFDTASLPTIDAITIFNSGTITLAPSAPTSLNMTNAARIQNAGTFDIQANLSAINGTSAEQIDNQLLLEKSSGADTTTISVEMLNSAGATGVQVQSGVLSLVGGGAGDAPFTIASGATLDFPSGTYILGSSGSVSGLGTLAVTGGTLSIGGVTEPGGFVLSGGVLDGGGFLSIGNSFTWSGGVMQGSGQAELAGGGTGSITGADGAMFLNGRTFNNYGFIGYTAVTNPLTLRNSSALKIYGTFDIQDDASINCVCTPTLSLVGVFPNGILMKSGGAGTSSISPTLQNDSTVWVSSGTLDIPSDGTHAGSFHAFGGATLQFSGTNTLSTGSSLTGDGTISFPSGTTTIDGYYSVSGLTSIGGGSVTISNGGDTQSLDFITGTLNLAPGSSTFDLYGNGTWSCGTIAGPGTFHVAPSAVLTIDAANASTILSAVLFNEGTINYTADPSIGNELQLVGGVINNAGLFDIQTDASISVSFIIVDGLAMQGDAAPLAAPLPDSFTNTGTLQKSGGTGTSEFEPELINDGGSVKALSGELWFQAAYTQNSGSTTLGPGSIKIDDFILLNGGVLDGEGTITGDVDNANGTVAPGSSPGVITITDDYTQGSGGTLAVELEGTAAGTFDQLNVGDTATLDGTLTATLLNGYTPPDGATFAVLTFASSSGTFLTENLPTYPVNGSFTSSYNATDYTLTAQVAPLSSDLQVAVSGPATVDAGAALSYTVTVSNQGPDAHSGTITVANTLPAGATGASGSGSGWTCGVPSGGVITCTNSTGLPVTQSLAALTFNMIAPPDPGLVQNSATVSSGTSDPTPGNNTNSASTTVIAQANLAITKNGPAGVTAGQNVVYTIVVTNNGPSQAGGVTVTDPTPANLTFVSNSGACATPFPCGLGTLTSGQSATITSTFSTSPSFSGNVTNMATVSTTTADPDGTDNSASATTNVGPQADLSVIKTGPASVNPGDNVVYTITVSNGGVSPATNTVVTDPTPIGLAFLSNSGSCGTPFPCNVGTLAAGQNATIFSTYTVPSNYGGPTITNTATASSDVSDPDPTDNSGVAITNVVQNADVRITKIGPSAVGPGQLITYTITATNGGPSPATGVVVSDPTPTGLTFVSNTGDCTGPFPCNVGTLAPGAAATIDATFNVPSSYAASSITNTATVTASVSDSDASNNTATVVTPITSQADLAITKSGPPSSQAGQTIVYTIVVTNNGPLSATNTFVSDPTPPGLTFVSNTGACTGPFPCGLGTLAPGQSVIITATYDIPANFASTSTSNTATVSSSTTDLVPGNDSATAITPLLVGPAADLSISKSGPASTSPQSLVSFTIVVSNGGPATATNVVVTDPTPAGLTFVSNSGACGSAFPCLIGSLNSGQSATITSTYFVDGSAVVSNTATVSSSSPDPSSGNNSDTWALITVSCPEDQAELLTPADAAVVSSPVAFSWTPVLNALSYTLTVDGPGPPVVIETVDSSAVLTLSAGVYSWTVRVEGDFGCSSIISYTSTFTVCDAADAPVASVVGQLTTGQTYSVQWNAVAGAAAYKLQESMDEAFTAPATTTVGGTSMAFTKNVPVATGYFYRVGTVTLCDPDPDLFSPTMRVTVVPVPLPDALDKSVTVQSGSTQPVTFRIFVPGFPNGTTTFLATTDQPFVAVLPPSGLIGPEGVFLTVTLDPTELTDGTWTGTVIVAFGSTFVSKFATEASPPTLSFPVSINLVTPITPVSPSQPASNAVIIPTAGHLAGVNSSWRSDIRLANVSFSPRKYSLSLNLGAGATASVKQTEITVDSGATTALDDIVRTWYGIGSLRDEGVGVLVIQPLDAAADLKTTVVSSRTFNAAANGTYGQFIPATPFTAFMGALPGLNKVLSLQQIAQSSVYRSNLGLVEGSGQPASVTVRVFDALGSQLLSLPMSLLAGEQRQLNAFLSQNGLASDNARIEVEHTGGNGRVTAYASVVDEQTGDPLLVSGVPLGSLGSNRFIVPGVADLNIGFALWRSDLRVFNAGAAPQSATFTFFPLDNPTASVSKVVPVNPGEVTAFDNVLQSLFGLSNVGGALHVTLSGNAPLIVTGRTFNQTPNGTLGQFIPAVTTDEAVGAADFPLQLVQLEESVRFRSNVGLTEVTGKPAIAELSVHLPGSKVTPTVQIPLAAFESKQFSVLTSLGLGATYNARISVRVTSGEGRVTAYASVIDKVTQDPTYVPAK